MDMSIGVINIIGKIPGSNDILLQSAPDIDALQERLVIYIVRSLQEARIIDVSTLQKILGKYAYKVDELDAYEFEPNQRVDELLAALCIVRTTNEMTGRKFIPAWQKPKQNEAMKSFTGKESWDGFMYEHVPIGTDDPDLRVPTIPIEVKSLKVHPYKNKFSNLNGLLDSKMPKFKSHFQTEGSVCAVIVLPYSTSKDNAPLRFDLKNATETMNKYIANTAVGCMLFFDVANESDRYTRITIKCTFVDKNPEFASNGNIKEVKLYELPLAKFKK